MAILPYLITAIGEELEIDISKPLNPFPEEVSRLYDYKDKFWIIIKRVQNNSVLFFRDF